MGRQDDVYVALPLSESPGTGVLAKELKLHYRKEFYSGLSEIDLRLCLFSIFTG